MLYLSTFQASWVGPHQQKAERLVSGIKAPDEQRPPVPRVKDIVRLLFLFFFLVLLVVLIFLVIVLAWLVALRMHIGVVSAAQAQQSK